MGLRLLITIRSKLQWSVNKIQLSADEWLQFSCKGFQSNVVLFSATNRVNGITHYDVVTWASWRRKSQRNDCLSDWIFSQPTKKSLMLHIIGSLRWDSMTKFAQGDVQPCQANVSLSGWDAFRELVQFKMLKIWLLFFTVTPNEFHCVPNHRQQDNNTSSHISTCTLQFKSNGIYFSNAYLIYPWSIFWSKLLTWHLSSVWWGWCEISYAYDYSSRLNDHSKSIRFEKRDIKTLATGTVFGGYFIIRDRLFWELKLFLFLGIEMKLVHKIILCVSGLELKLNLS